MKSAFPVVLCCSALLLPVLTEPAFSQTPPADTAVAEELRALRSSLDTAIGLLRLHLERRDEGTELRRVEIALLALSLKDRGLRVLEDERRNLQDELRQASAEKEELIAFLDEQFEETVDINPQMRQQQQQMRAHIEGQIERQRQLVDDLERRLSELETEILGRKREMEPLQRIVDEGLASLER